MPGKQWVDGSVPRPFETDNEDIPKVADADTNAHRLDCVHSEAMAWPWAWAEVERTCCVPAPQHRPDLDLRGY